jgi:hypothetical protein
MYNVIYLFKNLCTEPTQKTTSVYRTLMESKKRECRKEMSEEEVVHAWSYNVRESKGAATGGSAA